MDSFVDLIVLSMAVGAAMLLLLLLTSFIILSKRSNNLEDEINNLKEIIEKKDALNNNLKEQIQQLTTKFSTTQKTVSYIAENMDGLIDVQEKLTAKVNSLQENSSPKKLEPLVDSNLSQDVSMLAKAQQMIKDGYDLSIIEQETHLAHSELDMLYSVTSKKEVDNDSFIDVNVGENTSKVAGFKARSAYGIGTKSLSARQR